MLFPVTSPGGGQATLVNSAAGAAGALAGWALSSIGKKVGIRMLVACIFDTHRYAACSGGPTEHDERRLPSRRDRHRPFDFCTGRWFQRERLKTATLRQPLSCTVRTR